MKKRRKKITDGNEEEKMDRRGRVEKTKRWKERTG